MVITLWISLWRAVVGDRAVGGGVLRGVIHYSHELGDDCVIGQIGSVEGCGYGICVCLIISVDGAIDDGRSLRNA